VKVLSNAPVTAIRWHFCTVSHSIHAREHRSLKPPRFQPYLEDSFRNTAEGRRLAFDPEDMVRSQECLKGKHWWEWLTASCPALVIRGRDSRVTTKEQMEEMLRRRPGTTLKEPEGGHILHRISPEAFAAALRSFLECAPG